MFTNQVSASGAAMVGYNNVKFDYPMMHMLMEHRGEVSFSKLYRFGQKIINDGNRGFAWNHVVWERDRYCPQIDLMMIHHFDNKAKLTGLKLLEFNMRMNNIQELPYSPHEDLTKQQAAEVLKYNGHDVDATEMFFNETKDMLEFRYELSKQFGKDFTNFNDPKIGEHIVLETLKQKGVHLKKGDKTLRDFVTVKDILFDYIEFERNEFQQITKFFESAVVDVENIKGFFSNQEVDYNLACVMDPKDVTATLTDGKRIKFDKYLADEKLHGVDDTFKAKNIHCIVDGFRYDYGAGGIHGSITNKVLRSDDDYVIFDVDYASFYPNIAIKNKLYPEHIGKTWYEVMDFMFHERLRIGKKTKIGGAYKLGMNGSYGKSNDIHSSFYDPQYTLSITINGQLILTMLAEIIVQNIPDVEMIFLNTDGLCCKIPRFYEQYLYDLCAWSDSQTHLSLECQKYKMLAIRDVNNYTGELEDGKIKRKGAYNYNLGWHQNHSAIVVAKAAEAALIRNVNIESFIRNHLSVDPFDFYLRAKVPRSANLYLETQDMWGDQPIGKIKKVKQSNIVRYYISKSGGKLVKEMIPTEKKQDEWLNKPHWRHRVSGATKQSAKAPSGMWDKCEPPTKTRPLTRTGISSKWMVTVQNKTHGEPDLSDIDLNYYITETRKIVDGLLS